MIQPVLCYVFMGHMKLSSMQWKSERLQLMIQLWESPGLSDLGDLKMAELTQREETDP